MLSSCLLAGSNVCTHLLGFTFQPTPPPVPPPPALLVFVPPLFAFPVAAPAAARFADAALLPQNELFRFIAPFTFSITLFRYFYCQFELYLFVIIIILHRNFLALRIYHIYLHTSTTRVVPSTKAFQLKHIVRNYKYSNNRCLLAVRTFILI